MSKDNKIINLTDSFSDDRPLPERIATLYGFRLAYADVDGVRFYGVQDWIKGVVPKADVSKLWNALKSRRNQLSTRCRQLPYEATNKRVYQMDFTDSETLYLITQWMQANSGNRDEILLYLARSGVILDELIRNPEKAEEMFAELANEKEYQKLLDEGFGDEEAQVWVQTRRDLKEEWKKLRADWHQRGVSDGFEFARLTNDIQEVATGETATQAKKNMGIRKTSRDYLSAAENATIAITSTTSKALHAQRGSLGVDELSEDIKDVKPIIDAARPEIEKVFSKKRRRLPPGKPKGTA